MARPLRIEYDGAVYHVTSRGDGREDIYLSDDDRVMFLDVLAHVVDRFAWVCHAWCLMGNHYHLMIETPNGNLSRGMRQLNGVYTQQFNRTHRRVGHVFQGRFKAILIEKDDHLLELCRYIVRNPVAADMVKDVADWKWSSYQMTAGLSPKAEFTTIDWVLEQFGGSQQRYKDYVAHAPLADAPLADAKGSQVLGCEDFLKQAQLHSTFNREAPRLQRQLARSKLEDIDSGQASRGAWMTAAYRQHGYTMREIAEYANVHYSLISKIIKEWEGK